MESSIGYGGVEAYGFHALEGLQCMVERRRGGERGLVAVRALPREEVAAARDRGEWSEELFAAALRTLPVSPTPDLAKLRGEAPFYQLEYADGLRATVAMANGLAAQFAFAARIRGQRRRLDEVA